MSRLGRLPESGIIAAGIRMLGTVPAGGRVYLVPSLHLLAAPMRPVRCVPSAQRARQASLLATLRHEYARQGLCVVIVYRHGVVDDCSAAPGTVAALLHGPGASAFGVVPDGDRRGHGQLSRPAAPGSPGVRATGTSGGWRRPAAGADGLRPGLARARSDGAAHGSPLHAGYVLGVGDRLGSAIVMPSRSPFWAKSPQTALRLQRQPTGSTPRTSTPE